MNQPDSMHASAPPSSATLSSSARTRLSISAVRDSTAYEMLRSLVGSEMCIRDRFEPDAVI